MLFHQRLFPMQNSAPTNSRKSGQFAQRWSVTASRASAPLGMKSEEIGVEARIRKVAGGRPTRTRRPIYIEKIQWPRRRAHIIVGAEIFAEPIQSDGCQLYLRIRASHSEIPPATDRTILATAQTSRDVPLRRRSDGYVAATARSRAPTPLNRVPIQGLGLLPLSRPAKWTWRSHPS